MICLNTANYERLFRVCWHTHLLSFFDPSNAADDDFVASFKGDHLRHTVGGTGMIDVSEEENRKLWVFFFLMLTFFLKSSSETCFQCWAVETLVYVGM